MMSFFPSVLTPEILREGDAVSRAHLHRAQHAKFFHAGDDMSENLPRNKVSGKHESDIITMSNLFSYMEVV